MFIKVFHLTWFKLDPNKNLIKTHYILED